MDANAYRARAVELRKQGKLPQALEAIQQALRLNPNYPAAHFNLAAIRFAQGHTEAAIASWRKAIELNPDYKQAHAALAGALRSVGRIEEAVAAAQQAARIDPNYIEAHNELGLALHRARRHAEAQEAFERVLELNPQHVAALNNLANLFTDEDRPSQAAECFRRALAIDPDRIELLNNYATLLKSQAKIDEALDIYHRILAKRPDYWPAHSNLLLTLNCHPRADRGLLAEHLEWAKRHAEPLQTKIHPHTNDRSPDRRLRIGYVSPDFRMHSVAYFIEPILIAHDRAQFEIFCYSNAPRADRMTDSIRSHADHWREITGQSDDRVAELIREDAIDILVDLSGHTAHHRLLVFARKPAPVQATYLGYPNTTGLRTIDYRLTDAIADPPGMTESHHAETLMRLPNTFLCYRPPDAGIAPRATRPANDPVTFGSFNNFAKVSGETIALWSGVLRAVEPSRLLIKAECLGDEPTRGAVRDRFSAHSIDPRRIELLGREPNFQRHLETYRRVDIGLDTFPYHGTTTSCEAMWMGVPVITLGGHAHVSRVGASLLTNVGLPELIARSPDEFATIARNLAGDRARLESISLNLRAQLLGSPLCDAAGFTRSLESAYREMWKYHLTNGRR